MIIVKNRELLIPLPERYLGTSYDTSSEIRQFRIPRFAQNGTDLSPLTFYVDLLHADGSNAYDTITMGEVGNTNYKVVDDNYIILTWYITRNVLQNPGALFVQLRAMDSENTVRWGSYKAVFYVERHLNAPGNYGGSLTLIEQIQQDHNYFKSVIDEVAALPQYVDTAEAWAVGQRNGHDVASDDATYNNNAKYYSGSAHYYANQAQSYESAAWNHASDAEAYGTGKRLGDDVQSGDPAYHNNAKWYEQRANQWANNAYNFMGIAEAIAFGTVDGEPVDSEDPNYHNNAKYYAERANYHSNAALTFSGQANDFALDAEGWAVGQNGGVDVASTDPSYHNNAKYHAEQAANSATAAAGSAEQADAFSNLAGTHKDAAQLAAQQAANSATAAAGSAEQADAFSNLAGTHKDAAQLAAQQAANSATAAAGSALDASDYADQAAASAASLTVDTALSDASINPVQNKVITSEITDVKTALTKKADIASITGQLIAGKKSKTVSSTITILSEKNPVNVVSDFSTQKVVVHGRNRFNLDTASFAFSGYSGSQTLTKDADSITIKCNVSNASAYLYAYTTYTAEFDGDLFVSCEADTTGNIADVCVLVQLNGTSQTRLYGRGFLYEKITVAKGDAVRLMFYTHMGTTAYNTVTYKKIQLAYGGLYEYTPYKEDVTNEKLAEKTLTLPATAGAYVLATTANSAYKWIKLKEEYNTIPARLRPANNDTVADITVTGLPLITYNQTYNMTIGLGLSSAGTLGIYNNQNRTDFIAWVADNPVTITFMDCDGYEKLTDYTFTQGEIIELETAQDITYYYDDSAPTDKIVCFGDSITGMFGNECGYPAMLELLHGYDAVNVGFSGCRWTDHSNANYLPFCMNRLAEAISSGDYSLQDASPFVNTSSASYNPLYAEHLANLKTLNWGSVDYVTMFWGANDWGDGAILRSADDPSADNKQRTNVEDAIKYSINQIVSKYPWVKVIVITPYWRSITSGKDSNVDPNSNGAYLYDWSEFIGEVAQDNFNIPVIALYRTLGANVLTNRYFTQDGTHPTEMTKRIIADRIAATVEIY